jgi:hypothetical protein
VAEDVRRIGLGELDETARRLLREIGYQAEDNPTSDILPREAAENLDLDPSSPEYRAALEHLVSLGDIEREVQQDPNLPEDELYRLTRQGFRRAREIY